MSKMVDLTTMTASGMADEDRLLIHDEDAGTGGTDRTITVDEIFKRPLSPAVIVSGETVTTLESAVRKLNEKKQNQTLSTSISIDGTSVSTVETALGQLNTAKQNKNLSAPVTVAGVQNTTVEGALSALAETDSSPTAGSLKPVTSGGVKAALDLKTDSSLLGAANGIATLDEGGKVPSTQLPSYVDDVLEYENLAAFPATGESGKIYVAKDTNRTYRWGGTAYTEISESLALGETASTAYAGDKGKANADAIATLQTDKQDSTLATPVTVDGTERTTVEAAIGALNAYADKKLEQYSSLPLASAELVGKIVQYTGADTGVLTNGYFYVCKEGETAGTYEWVQKVVQRDISVDSGLDGTSTNPVENRAVTEAVNSKLTVTATMPTASEEYKGKQILYVGPSTTTLNKGGVYECGEVAGTDPTEYEWTLISANPLEFNSEDFEVENNEVSLAAGKKIKTFLSTQAEWDALSTAEKTVYDICDLKDDVAGGDLIVSDTVTEGDLNPVTSSAVATAIHTLLASTIAEKYGLIFVEFTTSTSEAVWVAVKTANYFAIQLTATWNTYGIGTVCVYRNGPGADINGYFIASDNTSTQLTFSEGVSNTFAGFYNIKYENSVLYIGRATADTVVRANIVRGINLMPGAQIV